MGQVGALSKLQENFAVLNLLESPLLLRSSRTAFRVEAAGTPAVCGLLAVFLARCSLLPLSFPTKGLQVSPVVERPTKLHTLPERGCSRGQ